jgi:hypothetical protein
MFYCHCLRRRLAIWQWTCYKASLAPSHACSPTLCPSDFCCGWCTMRGLATCQHCDIGLLDLRNCEANKLYKLPSLGDCIIASQTQAKTMSLFGLEPEPSVFTDNSQLVQCNVIYTSNHLLIWMFILFFESLFLFWSPLHTECYCCKLRGFEQHCTKEVWAVFPKSGSDR